VQIWVPDTRTPEFAAEIRRQCALINAADRGKGLMDWVEAVGILDDEP
jgi:hypothetical protein